MDIDKIKPAAATLVAMGCFYALAARLKRAPDDDQAQSGTLPSPTQMDSVGTQTTAVPRRPMTASAQSQSQLTRSTATFTKLTTRELLQAIEQLRGHDIPEALHPQFMHALRDLRNYQGPFTHMVKQLFIEGLWIHDNDTVDLADYVTKAFHQDELSKVEKQRDQLSGQLRIVKNARDDRDNRIQDLIAQNRRDIELEKSLEVTTSDLKAALAEKLITEEARDKLQNENIILQQALATTNETLETTETAKKTVEQALENVNDRHRKTVSDLESTHISKKEYERLHAELLRVMQDRDMKIFEMEQLHQQELQKFQSDYKSPKSENEIEISRMERSGLGVTMDIEEQEIENVSIQIMTEQSDSDTTKPRHEEETGGTRRTNENVRTKIRSIVKLPNQIPSQSYKRSFPDNHEPKDLINTNNAPSVERVQDLNVAAPEEPHNTCPGAQVDKANMSSGCDYGTPETQQVPYSDAEMPYEDSARGFSYYEQEGAPSFSHSEHKSILVQNPEECLTPREYDPSELVPDLTVAQIERFREVAAAKSQLPTPLSNPIYTCHWKCGESFFGEEYPEKVWEHALKCQHCKNEGKPVACTGCGKIFLDNKTFRTQHGRLCHKGQLPVLVAADHQRKEQELRARSKDDMEQVKLPTYEKPCWNENDGSSCTNPKCPFKHMIPRPPSGTNDSQPHEVQCKFEREFGSCTKAKCPFKHTQPLLPKHDIQCKFEQKFGACSKKTCTYKHTTPRPVAMIDRTLRYDSGGSDFPSSPKKWSPRRP